MFILINNSDLTPCSNKDITLIELSAFIFRNWLHFEQIYVKILYIVIYVIYVNIIIIRIFC